MIRSFRNILRFDIYAPTLTLFLRLIYGIQKFVLQESSFLLYSCAIAFVIAPGASHHKTLSYASFRRSIPLRVVLNVKILSRLQTRNHKGRFSYHSIHVVFGFRWTVGIIRALE